MLTCDYERSRPHATPLEWDLYTRSLRAWPATLMDLPRPYGRLRRAGIVDINERDHHDLVTEWHRRLHQPAYTARMTARTTRWHQDTARSLARAETALAQGDAASAGRELRVTTSVLLAVMSTHIVNWLLPEAEWEHALAGLLGNRRAAADCLMALMTPSTTGHLLAAHVHHLDADIHELRTGDRGVPISPGVGAFRATTGAGEPAASSVTGESRPPQPGHAQSALTEITTARLDAATTRHAWATAALLAAAGNTDALRHIELIATLCEWSATSEESRAILRARYLCAADSWCELTGTNPTTITTADFTPEARP